MRLAQVVRACGVLLVLGVAGFGGGCSSGSAPAPVSKEEDAKTRESMKSAHQSLKLQKVGRQGSDAFTRKSMKAAHGGH
jgi:hypothetical protein